jgi:hypothetical protein
MRILLQSFESGLYLDTSGEWTSTSDLARNFANTRQAADFKIHHRLTSVFVVVLPEPAPPANATGTHDEPGWPPGENGSGDNDEGRPIDPESVNGGKPSNGFKPRTM